jgi:hypothetical protein
MHVSLSLSQPLRRQTILDRSFSHLISLHGVGPHYVKTTAVYVFLLLGCEIGRYVLRDPVFWGISDTGVDGEQDTTDEEASSWDMYEQSMHQNPHNQKTILGCSYILFKLQWGFPFSPSWASSQLNCN